MALPSAILDQRFDLLRELADKSADMAKNELEDIRKSFTVLDTKASTCSTVAAGVVAIVGTVGKFGQPGALLKFNSATSEAFLLVPVGLAVATIILSLIATKVQELPSPHSIESAIKELSNLRDNIEGADFSQERAYNFSYSRLIDWKKAIVGNAEKVSRKAKWVGWCQSTLSLSLGTLGFLLIVAIFRGVT